MTSIFLNHNKITSVDNDAFVLCPNLKFLALQDNQIKEWFDLSYLSHLDFLDLSNNKIEDNKIDYLPANLMIVKLQGNPLCQATDAGLHKYHYRKQYVMALPELD